jgi:DnaJ-class molecular chaperone
MEHVTQGFYHCLGVPFDADATAIKKAFRKLSLKLHPDRNREDESAKDKFQLVNSAYACLSDEARRKQYDSIFHMRCALDQGALTADGLRQTELDVRQPGANLATLTMSMSMSMSML